MLNMHTLIQHLCEKIFNNGADLLSLPNNAQICHVYDVFRRKVTWTTIRIHINQMLDVALWQGGCATRITSSFDVLPFVSLPFRQTLAIAMCPTKEVEGVQKGKLGFHHKPFATKRQTPIHHNLEKLNLHETYTPPPSTNNITYR